MVVAIVWLWLWLWLLSSRSSEYDASANCNLELDHALSLNKPIVFLTLEKSPKRWASPKVTSSFFVS